MKRVLVVLIAPAILFALLALAIKPNQFWDWFFIAVLALVLGITPVVGKAAGNLNWRRQITPTGSEVTLAGEDAEASPGAGRQ